MQEYDTWFEVYVYDGHEWIFYADFDTSIEAQRCAAEVDYEEARIKKARGQA